MAATAVVKEDEQKVGDIKFFGRPDMVLDKESGEWKVSSSYPAWYFERHIGMLREDYDRCERALQWAEQAEVPNLKASMERIKKRIKEIEESRPILNDRLRNLCGKLYQKCRAAIQESLFSRSDMLKGLADPHEELRRQKEPIFSGFNDRGEEGALFKLMNISHVSGKFSRDQLGKAYKILGKLIGEDINVERLRRDESTGTFRPEKSMYQLIEETK